MSSATEESRVMRITRTKTEQVPATISPLKPVEIKFDSTGCKDSVVVVVVTDGTTRQMSLHRPIGYTTLQDDEWVISSSEDLALILARKEHPKKQEYGIGRRKALQNRYLASRAEALYEQEDGLLVYKRVARNALVKAAKKKSHAKWRIDNPVQQAQKGRKRPPKPIPEPEDFYIGFMSMNNDAEATLVHNEEADGEDVRELHTKAGMTQDAFERLSMTQRKSALKEKGFNKKGNALSISSSPGVLEEINLQATERTYFQFIKNKSNLKAAHDSVAEEAFETKGGIPPSRSQTSCPHLKGASKEEAVDKVINLIAATLCT